MKSELGGNFRQRRTPFGRGGSILLYEPETRGIS